MPPAVLYKFLDKNGAKASLSRLTIKLSPPNQLNDPFEFMPGGYSGDTEEERVRREMELLITEKYRLHWNSSTRQNISQEDWPSFIRSIPGKDIRKLASVVFNSLQQRNWQPLVDKISECLGLSCFSECTDNILMWSHYAQSHQGIVIGYDLQGYSDIFKVDYSQNRKKIPLSSTCDDDETRKSVMREVMTTKSLDWQYEKEWRLICKLPVPQENNLFLLGIDASIIKPIFFGMKASMQFVDEILSIVEKLPNCRDIQLFKMFPQQETFSLCHKPLEAIKK